MVRISLILTGVLICAVMLFGCDTSQELPTASMDVTSMDATTEFGKITISELKVLDQNAILAAPAGEENILPDACVNISLSPDSVSIPIPRFLAFVQISGRITIGDCGMIICSKLNVDSTWDSSPGIGLFEFGPFPARSPGQVCQGGSFDFNEFIIITRKVPAGTYTLRFKVGGFGGVTYKTFTVTIT